LLNLVSTKSDQDQYARVRNKVTYPEALYQKLTTLCGDHHAALDIGCGNGVSSIRLKPYFKVVNGVDLGEKLIQHAKQSYPDINFYVSKVEEFDTDQQYDLVTSATSFYWMQRELVCEKLASWLKSGGLFCAYKYDFPVVYGPLRDFIVYELATKWLNYRDKRLVQYDDTLEVLDASGVFSKIERFVESNIIELSVLDVAYFFLSTSYVTKYIEESGDQSYAQWFIERCHELEKNETVKVNFDIYAFLGKTR